MLSSSNLVEIKINSSDKFNGLVYGGFVYINGDKVATSATDKEIVAIISEVNSDHKDRLPTETNEDRMPMLVAVAENWTTEDRKMVWNLFRALRKADDPISFIAEATVNINEGKKLVKKEWI